MTSVTCHYAVLGVERDAQEEELRKAYRKLALQWHPDKNQQQIEMATEVFKQVQAAYAVLSDPQERSWYDAHREAILRGKSGTSGDEFDDPVAHLWAFFSTSAYSGYGDDEDGFYAVYDAVFHGLESEEKAPDSEAKIPRFGSAQAEWSEVKAFYSWWEGFSTTRSCATADKYDTRQAPSRQIRRMMEKENNKKRVEARRQVNECVRNLVGFVKKRDGRVAAHRTQQEKENKAKLARARAAALVRNAQIEEARQAQRCQLNLGRDHEAEAELDALVEEYASDDAKKVREESINEDNGDEDVRKLFCLACNKSFKSQLQMNNHERSRKHAEAVRRLREELEAEDAQFAAEIRAVEAEVKAEADEMAQNAAVARYVEALDGQSDESGDEDVEEGEIDGEDADVMEERLEKAEEKGSARAKARARKAARRGKAEKEETLGVGREGSVRGKWSNKRAGSRAACQKAPTPQGIAPALRGGESSSEKEGELMGQEEATLLLNHSASREGRRGYAAKATTERQQARLTSAFAHLRFADTLSTQPARSDDDEPWEQEMTELEEGEAMEGFEEFDVGCFARLRSVEKKLVAEGEELTLEEEEEDAQQLASEQLRGKSAGRDFLIGLLDDEGVDPLLSQPKLEVRAYSFSADAAAGSDKVNRNKEKKKMRAEKKSEKTSAAAELTRTTVDDELTCVNCGVRMSSRSQIAKHRKHCR